MKRLLTTLVLGLAICLPASATSYTVGVNYQQGEFVVGNFSDAITFTSTSAKTPITVTLSQIFSYYGGGSGRGGGYHAGGHRSISLTSARICNLHGKVLETLTGSTTLLTSTFKLKSGSYIIEVSGVGTGTNGSGEYGVLVQQVQPPPPPPPDNANN